MLTDIEIAQQSKMRPITEIAADIGLTPEQLDLYGKYKAKIPMDVIQSLNDRPDGKLILVTAINPTPAGEGKTTTSVGLGMAMNKIGMQTIIALREPSMGPVMGIKGGAAGGGYSQVLPMEDINLHFTGDMHAITAANNLLSATIDNHIHHGNELGIDPRQITWKRCMDMNDRSLRHVIVGLGGRMNSYPREDSFNITVASEIMAILCLSNSLTDLNKRIGDILVAYNYSGEPVYAKDLHVEGAMTLLLKDALCPNLVQTIEGTPAFVHGGPFANIAHGCNSILATKTALKLADYVVTEAGFGADLGAEKFFDIKCRFGGLKPCAVVLVATIRALKYNGGVAKDMLKEENVDALEKGICNLDAHIANLRKFGIQPIVAFNHFDTDSEAEITFLTKHCEDAGVPISFSDVFAQGGDGGIDLAHKLADVIGSTEGEKTFHQLYETDLSIKEKVNVLAEEIYGAATVTYSASANKTIKQIESIGKQNLPICVAKTQYSFSDNPKLLGRPTGFELTVSEVRLMSGANFIVILTGDVMTMPGLPKLPAAERMTVSDDGTITGLF